MNLKFLNRRVFLFLFVHLIFGLSQGLAAKSTTPQIPLRDFFKNPQEAGHLISPDGTQVAVLKPWESRMNLFVRSLKEETSSNDKQITQVKDRDISKFFWKGNQILIFSRDFGGDENDHLFSANLKTGKIIDLTPFERTKASVLFELEDVSDNEILVQHNRRDPKVFDVYRINVFTGASTLVVVCHE